MPEERNAHIRDPLAPSGSSGDPAADIAIDIDRVLSELGLPAGAARRQPSPEPPVPTREPSALDRRMADAEREAKDFIEAAKRRAERIVTTTIGAAERDVAELRREAEEAMRRRWEQVEVDAGNRIDEAELISRTMVLERHRQITGLSDGIATRALALTAGMDDAVQVRARFERFVRALSATADGIAAAAPSGASQEADPSPLPRRTDPADGALAA